MNADITIWTVQPNARQKYEFCYIKVFVILKTVNMYLFTRRMNKMIKNGRKDTRIDIGQSSSFLIEWSLYIFYMVISHDVSLLSLAIFDKYQKALLISRYTS